MAVFVKALTIWTGKQTASLVFDSDIDEFTATGFFDKVKNKPNIAGVCFTTNGDVFGVCFSVAVTEMDSALKDPNVFAFSFESHGRCFTPKMFILNSVVKWKETVCMCTDEQHRNHGFMRVSNTEVGGELFFGNSTHQPFCHNIRKCFDGLDDTTLTRSVFYKCVRFLAVQLE